MCLGGGGRSEGLEDDKTIRRRRATYMAHTISDRHANNTLSVLDRESLLLQYHRVFAVLPPCNHVPYIRHMTCYQF